MEKEVLKIAKRIQAIAQTGLRFTKDDFDRERFEELRDLSVDLIAQVSDAKIEKIRELFTCETGFQTPKIDVRGVILDQGRILLTKEKSDNKWSLPGGYADINYSPNAIVEKEVFEETGLRVAANRVLAVIDTNSHNFPPLEYHFYKIIILCDMLEGDLRGSNETISSAYFDFDNLPDLSEKRNTYELLKLIQAQLETKETYID